MLDLAGGEAATTAEEKAQVAQVRSVLAGC